MKIALLAIALALCAVLASADYYDRSDAFFENAARNENAKWWTAFEYLIKNAHVSNGNQTRAQFNQSAIAVMETFFTNDGVFTSIDRVDNESLSRTGHIDLADILYFVSLAHGGENHVGHNVAVRGECGALRCVLEQSVIGVIQIGFSPFRPNRVQGAYMLIETDVITFVRNSRTEPFKIAYLLKEVTHRIKVAEYGGEMLVSTI